MAKRQTTNRKPAALGGTVKLTVETPAEIHARLVSFAAMSRPRRRPSAVVLEWIRDGLREWHPGVPKLKNRGPANDEASLRIAEGDERAAG